MSEAVAPVSVTAPGPGYLGAGAPAPDHGDAVGVQKDRMKPIALLASFVAAACVAPGARVAPRANEPVGPSTGPSPSGAPPAGAAHVSAGAAGTPIEAAPPPATEDGGAHRDAGGFVVAPGGRITTLGPCGAAQDHCLRAGGWFSSSWTLVDAEPADAIAVFPFEGAYWTWQRPEARAGTAYRTIPATADNARTGAAIVVFDGRSYGALGDPPPHEDAALTSAWLIGTIGEVDATAATFRFAGKKTAIPLAAARIVVETIAP